MLRLNRKTVLLLGSLIVLAIGYWFLQNYSPYQICLRHSEAEALSNGMSQETAKQYAEGLCKSKLPLRN